MRIYLELYEIVTVESTAEPDFIRIDVTEWSKYDIDTAIQLLIKHAQQSYTSYIIQMHYCRHDENQLCTVTIIDTR